MTDGQASLSSYQATIWEPWPIFPLFFKLFFDSYGFVGAPSLTRRRVCSCQVLLGLASGVFLGSESSGHMITFYRFNF
jgi:hypothetical protein